MAKSDASTYNSSWTYHADLVDGWPLIEGSGTTGITAFKSSDTASYEGTDAESNIWSAASGDDLHLVTDGNTNKRNYVSTNTPLTAYPFTIIARARPNSTNPSTLCSIVDASTSTHWINFTGITGQFQCLVRSGAGVIINTGTTNGFRSAATQTWDTGTWYTLGASVVDGGTSNDADCTLYIDGSDASATNTGSSASFPSGLDEFQISAADRSAGDTFGSWDIDFVLVFDAALNSTAHSSIHSDPYQWLNQPATADEEMGWENHTFLPQPKYGRIWSPDQRMVIEPARYLPGLLSDMPGKKPPLAYNNIFPRYQGICEPVPVPNIRGTASF